MRFPVDTYRLSHCWTSREARPETGLGSPTVHRDAQDERVLGQALGDESSALAGYMSGCVCGPS